MTENAQETYLRVLVVDDARAIRMVLLRLLSTESDLEVLGAAESGEEALDFALTRDPNVVIMDVDMPGIGGIEATRILLERMPKIRVVGYSAHDGEDLMRSAGAADFVHKGDSAKRLLEAIRGN